MIEAARKDPTALARLYREHYSAIYGYVLKRVADHDHANDIVADVFLAMVRGLPRYRSMGIPFRCWLLRIATNQVYRWSRRHRWFRIWKVFDETLFSPKESVERDEPMEQLRKAILRLPCVYQTVISLHYQESMSVESIAAVLQCRPGTVKSRLSRGRELLRQSLTQNEDSTLHEPRTVGPLSEEFEV